MAIPVYLSMTDESGKPVKGSVDVKGREGSVEVLHLDHTVFVPADSSTGRLTGARVHKPFTFYKVIDASSPYLYKAACTGQCWKEMLFKFFHVDGTGKEAVFFTVKLENVKVVKASTKMNDVRKPENAKEHHFEEIEVSYERITWNYTDGNIIYTDSWNERATA